MEKKWKSYRNIKAGYLFSAFCLHWVQLYGLALHVQNYPNMVIQLRIG